MLLDGWSGQLLLISLGFLVLSVRPSFLGNRRMGDSFKEMVAAVLLAFVKRPASPDGTPRAGEVTDGLPRASASPVQEVMHGRPEAEAVVARLKSTRGPWFPIFPLDVLFTCSQISSVLGNFCSLFMNIPSWK